MPPAAMGFALSAFLMFSCLDAGAKWLVTGGYAVLFVAWVRFAVQGIVLFVVYRGWSNKRLWRMENRLLQVVRGLLLPAMTVFNFLALRHLQLAETVSVLLATPILVTILAGPLLGEWAGPRRWAAILVGFTGVLLVVRPGTEVFDLPVVFILAAMTCNGFYFILTRKLAARETPESLIFYSCLFAIVIFAPFAFAEAALPKAPLDAGVFVIVGLAGMVGHMALIRASRLADASKVSPFQYSQVIWMAAFGFFIFGDLPDLWTVAGTLVICASGLYLMNRERQIRKQRRTPA